MWRRPGGAGGCYVVVAGPDGTGKSTVVDHLRAGLASPVLHLHHRPRVLGGLTTHAGPVTEPHKYPPYPRPISLAKVLYLFADNLLGWILRIRPVLRRGGTVIMERGWWDLAVDPARYRLRPHPRLVATLGRLLPSPSATVLLLADTDVLTARTDELDPAELARQVAAWRALPTARLRSREIDVSAPLPVVLDRVRSALAASGGPSPSWTGLPRSTQSRWVLPRTPRAAAANGLRVYSPVTPRAVLGWKLARAATRLGAAALLPAAPVPQRTLEAVADLIPPGGTIGVGHGSHPGRRVAMILDENGAPIALAKLVDDDMGEAALAAEEAGLAALAPHLPGSLRVPALLSSSPRRLVYEAVRWAPRAAPWRLPVDVAYGLGALYAAGEHDGLGPAHGDCGPWNLLRTRAGWYLVDWADATEDAPAFTDLWHYVVQAHALIGRPHRRAVLAGVAGHGHVREAVLAYSAAAGLDSDLARPGLITYLQRTWGDQRPETRDGQRGRAARAALLAALGQEIPS